MARISTSVAIPVTIFMLLALPWAAPRSAAAANIVISDSVQLHLADAFMADGEYYRAITEYLKFTYLFPDSPQVNYALTQIGMANYRGEEYQAALKYFSRVRRSGDKRFFVRAALYEGLCLQRLGQQQKAYRAFERAYYFAPEDENARQALMAAGLTATAAGQTAAARQALRQLCRHADDEQAHRAKAAMRLLDDDNSEEKSPLTAAVLAALLPGSGHIYAGRNGDGFMAFMVNGLFIGATCIAIHDENYPAAALFGAAEVPFYLGNIHSASHAATQWNLGLRRSRRDAMAITIDYHY